MGATLAAGLGACVSSSRPSSAQTASTGRVAQNQGSSWELVLPAGGTDLAFEGRRDPALGVREYQTPTALDRWEPARRTLRRPRFLHVPRGSERFIYFEFERSWDR